VRIQLREYGPMVFRFRLAHNPQARRQAYANVECLSQDCRHCKTCNKSGSFFDPYP
jgi:hypothetical protein